jgi:hypothetical protein
MHTDEHRRADVKREKGEEATHTASGAASDAEEGGGAAAPPAVLWSAVEDESALSASTTPGTSVSARPVRCARHGERRALLRLPHRNLGGESLSVA